MSFMPAGTTGNLMRSLLFGLAWVCLPLSVSGQVVLPGATAANQIMVDAEYKVLKTRIVPLLRSSKVGRYRSRRQRPVRAPHRFLSQIDRSQEKKHLALAPGACCSYRIW